MAGHTVCHRLGDGADQDLVAKHIAVALLVGFLVLGPLIVERTAERETLVVGTACHGVDVGSHAIALEDGVADDAEVLVVKGPRFLVERGALGRVGTQDGTQRTKLEPAYIEFGVYAVGVHVAADVVAPVAIEHVGGGGVEVGLEVERFPADDGVAREAYLVAVVTQPAPAVVEHRALLAMALHVGEGGIVYPPGVAEPWELLVVESLLPV